MIINSSSKKHMSRYLEKHSHTHTHTPCCFELCLETGPLYTWRRSSGRDTHFKWLLVVFEYVPNTHTHTHIHTHRNRALWLSGYLAFWLSGYLAIWLSGSLVLWFSGSLAPPGNVVSDECAHTHTQTYTHPNLGQRCIALYIC
jgi:hypothetical protein